MDSEPEEDDHVMGWIVQCSPLLFFGPRPQNKQDALYLATKLHVDVILSLCPLTGRLTKSYHVGDRRISQFDTSMWYAAVLEKEECATTVKHVYLPKNMDERKKALQVNDYVRAAQEIRRMFNKDKTRNQKRIYYIHERDGDFKEALVAIAIRMLMHGNIDIEKILTWLETEHPRVLRLGEQKELLRLVAQRASRLSGGMDSIFTAATDKKASIQQLFLQDKNKRKQKRAKTE